MITMDVHGVDEFLVRLDVLDDLTEDVADDAGTFAATLTVAEARPTVPRVTGAAADSLRVVDYEDGGAAVGGSSAVPYYGWLEFGGDAGVHHSVHRAVVSGGRYLQPAYVRVRGEVLEHMADLLEDAIGEAGLS